MIYGIYHSAAGGITQLAKMDLIANNLANVNTPAFKRDIMVFVKRLSEPIEDGPYAFHNSLLDRMDGGLFIARTHTNWEPGPIASTGRKFDFAIDGEGYFMIDIDGKKYLTRAGNFTLDNAARLVTADGRGRVQSSEGTDIVVTDPINFTITKERAIIQNGEITGQIATYIVDNPEVNLKKVGDNLYEVTGQGGASSYNARVEQGALEGSSVNAVAEMAELINTVRLYEANMQLMRFQDSTLDRAVNDIARIPR